MNFTTDSSNTPPVEKPLHAQTEASAPSKLLLKAATVADALDIGRTLLRELHTQGHRNYDPDFPTPITLTPGGHAYFVGDELRAWVLQRAKAFRTQEPQKGDVGGKRIQGKSDAHSGELTHLHPQAASNDSTFAASSQVAADQ